MKKKLLSIFTAGTMSYALLSSISTTVFASNGSSGGSKASNAGCGVSYIVMLAVMLVAMYFILIRPQKKQEKETKSLQESVKIGDEIITYGGIVGLVINVNGDSVVIETGGERNKLRIKKWAVKENVTVSEQIAQEQAKEKEKKKNPMAAIEKENKKSKKSKKNKEEPEGPEIK